MKSLDRAIRLMPKRAQLYALRGYFREKQDEWQEAIKDFDTAIQLKPSISEFYLDRGLANWELGRFQDGIDDYSEAITIAPRFAEAYSNRAAAFANLGIYGKALEDYSKSMKINQHDYRNWDNRARIYIAIGKYDLALSDLNRAIELRPNNVFALINRSLVLSIQGLREQAQLDIESAMEVGLDHAFSDPRMMYDDVSADSLRAFAGVAFCFSQMPSKALELIPNYTENKSHDPLYHLACGLIFLFTNKIEMANTAYSKGLEYFEIPPSKGLMLLDVQIQLLNEIELLYPRMSSYATHLRLMLAEARANFSSQSRSGVPTSESSSNIPRIRLMREKRKKRKSSRR